MSNKKTKVQILQRRRRLDDSATPHAFELYRTARLAELFHVNRATIFRWKRSGKLGPWVRIGGVEAMTGARVAELLQQQEAADASS